jgi:integrase
MACVTKRRNRYILDFCDQHGERRWVTLPKGTTKAEAKEALRDIEDAVAKGVYLPRKKTPLFSEVAKDWLEYKRPRLRETTWEVYVGHVRNHFQDLDPLKINRITIAIVEKFITDRQMQGMNIGTLRKILVGLGQIFNYAARHRYLDYNPLREAERPRESALLEEDQPGTPEDMKILTPLQINALLAQVKEPKYHALFMLAIFSGARQGEILALRWSDVDWQNSQLHIRRTFNNGRLFTPKTATSKRKIDLGPTVLMELKKWRIACPKNDLDLVFPN